MKPAIVSNILTGSRPRGPGVGRGSGRRQAGPPHWPGQCRSGSCVGEDSSGCGGDWRPALLTLTKGGGLVGWVGVCEAWGDWGVLSDPARHLHVGSAPVAGGTGAARTLTLVCTMP